MTFSRMLPRSRSLAVAAALTLACLLGRPALAGQDDFEFGQKLAQKGMFDLAKKVYERMLADPKQTAAGKDKANYGMAILGREEARSFAGLPDSVWADIKAKYEAAAQTIQDFVNRNAADAKIDTVKMELGNLFLQIVEWVNEHLNPDEPDPVKRDATVDAFLARMKATKDALFTDAQGYVDKAIALFDAVHQGAKAKEDQEMGGYYLATAQYFRGAVHPPCSAPAIAAYDQALKTLEDYATANEERLTGSYAMDFLGLAQWEEAKCKTDPKERLGRYSLAQTWFEACTSIENQSIDHLKLIMRGYYHLAQMCLEAGQQDVQNFLKIGSNDLKKMEKSKDSTKVPMGCRAYLEWAKIEAKRKNSKEAIRLARYASDQAKANLFGDEERLANKLLTEIVQGAGQDESSSGGGAESAGVDPSVLVKIADNLYVSGKYADAVRAYQQVVAASPRTPEGTIKYYIPAWQRIGTCYDKQDPPLRVEAAMAFETIVEEYVAGRIPKAQSGTAEVDPNYQSVYDAANSERRALQFVAEKTGEAVVKAHIEKINAFLLADAEMARISSARGSDLAYSSGQTAFDQARRDKDANAPGWKDGFAKAREFFLEASRNVKSERQDNAWVYLIRVQSELEDYAGAVAAADAAFKYWDGPEAKKKETEVPTIVDSRKSSRAQATYYKADALHQLKRDDEALKVLTGYATAFPKVEPPVYKQLAMGLEVQVLLAQNRVQDADALTTKLIQDYPDYFMLSKIVFQLAKYYEDQGRAIEARMTPLNETLYGPANAPAEGLLSKIRAGVKAEETLAGSISDDNNELDRLRRIIENSKEPAEVKAAQEKYDQLKPSVDKKLVDLEALRKQNADLTTQAEGLQAQKAKVRGELVDPRSKAAAKYWEWDQTVQKADAATEGKKKRLPENVRNFALQYYNLAKLKPEERSYWERARTLYEAYLQFPEVAALSNASELKRPHLGRLGEVDYHLADSTKDPKEARALYEQAVDRIQSVLAKHPDNTTLVIGHLSGEYVTIPWQSIVLERRFMIPVQRSADVTAFRKYVEEMKGDQVPHYSDPGIDKRFREQVLPEFQKAIHDMSDPTLKRTVDSLKGGGFDPIFFSELANVQKEFLLPLAHAYAQSGTQVNALKALNVTQALLIGPNKLEDDTAEWWETKSIVLECYVAMAERAIASAGPKDPDADKAKQADTMISSVKRIYPHIGGAERHDQTLAEWKAFQDRNRKNLAAIGVREVVVDLTAEAAPQAPPAAPKGSGPSMEGGVK